MNKPVQFDLKVAALKSGRWTVRGVIPGGFGIDTVLTTQNIRQLEVTFFGKYFPTFHQLKLEQALRLPTFDELAA